MTAQALGLPSAGAQYGSSVTLARWLEMGREFWYTGENPQKMGKGRIFL